MRHTIANTRVRIGIFASHLVNLDFLISNVCPTPLPTPKNEENVLHNNIAGIYSFVGFADGRDNIPATNL